MVTTTTVQRLPHPLWASKTTCALWLADVGLRLAIVVCSTLMCTALAQIIGDIHDGDLSIPQAPAKAVGIVCALFVVCFVSTVLVSRELRFRSPGALIEEPSLQPVVWPRVLRILLGTTFTLWLVATQIRLDIPVMTAFWTASGFALAGFGIAGLIRDAILDRRRWMLDTVIGLAGISEGLVQVLLCRPWRAEADMVLPLFILCAFSLGIEFVRDTVRLLRGDRAGRGRRFDLLRAVEDASEGLTQLVVDRYDPGATLKTRDQWKRWISIGLIAVTVILVGSFIISLFT